MLTYDSPHAAYTEFSPRTRRHLLVVAVLGAYEGQYTSKLQQSMIVTKANSNKCSKQVPKCPHVTEDTELNPCNGVRRWQATRAQLAVGVESS